jgi:tetratricopeptide (TPR) repeat protein
MARPWLARFWVQLGIAGSVIAGGVGLLLSQRGDGLSSSLREANSFLREARPALGRALPELRLSLEEKGLTRTLKELEARCTGDSPPLGCLRQAVRAALDLDQPRRALDLLGSSGAGTAELDGERAEALAREGKVSEAEAVRKKMGSRADSDPFAAYAAAHAAYLADQRAEARGHAERAASLGRGGPAHVLLTLLAFRSRDWVRARQATEAALALEPESVDALYNRALIDQHEGRYHAAREGFLEVLRRAPGRGDARYNRALLTSDAGAEAEAQHHLKKLRGLLGEDDPRVQALARRVNSGAGEARAGARAASARAESQGP